MLGPCSSLCSCCCGSTSSQPETGSDFVRNDAGDHEREWWILYLLETSTVCDDLRKLSWYSN